MKLAVFLLVFSVFLPTKFVPINCSKNSIRIDFRVFFTKICCLLKTVMKSDLGIKNSRTLCLNIRNIKEKLTTLGHVA